MIFCSGLNSSHDTDTVDTNNSLYSDHKIPEAIVTDSRLYDEKCSSYTDTVGIQNSLYSDSEDVEFLNHGYDEDGTNIYIYIYIPVFDSARHPLPMLYFSIIATIKIHLDLDGSGSKTCLS